MSRGDMDFAEKLHNAYNGKVIFHIYTKKHDYYPYDINYINKGDGMEVIIEDEIIVTP